MINGYAPNYTPKHCKMHLCLGFDLAVCTLCVLVVWTRLIMPNGTSMIIDNLPGVDMSGGAGLHDKVNYHYGKMLKAALISTILGVGTELGRNDDDSELLNAVRDSSQNSFNHAGQQIIERNLGVQPTITVRPGTRLRVIVNKDLILQPYQY
ncbi:MAG: hypothetical protein COB36_13515 [Alphaproteobacteria bacterium]|nr:MAG: hypothetical protein COB36_13515 [Alphaproteobacteria bacterium]